ncbi:MAG: fluoride efflux transporter CrcB [Chitinophagaceae bacterium]|nr:fluoride efflux transporter CrcB [Chitinophagaceae bacterium]
MLFKNVLWIALGGGLGSVLRYLAHKWISSATTNPFPLGTLLVNVIGCLLIGIFFALSLRQNYLSTELKLFLMTGLCGGFTTFSAFTLEGMNLINEQRLLVFFLYFSCSIVLGLAATFAGYLLAR